MCVGGDVLCVCLNMPVYVLGIGLWSGRGGLNIGASGGEDRCAACRGGGHGLISGILRNEHVTEGSSGYWTVM